MTNFNQQLVIEACPNCNSDNVQSVNSVAYGVKCMDCFKVKVQCCDSEEEAINIWNSLQIIK